MSKSCCCDCCCCSSRCCDCLTFLLWGFCPSRKCCCKCDCSNKKGPHCPPHRRFDDGVKEEWEGGWGMRRDGNRRNKFEGNIANSVLREMKTILLKQALVNVLVSKTLIIVESIFKRTNIISLYYNIGLS